MLAFFRRFINSKTGLLVTFAVLAVIALAFAAGDVTGIASGGGGLLGSPVATVDGKSVAEADVRKRAQDEVRIAQQDQPGLDMAGFVAAGGVESLVNRMVNSLALEAFAHANGIRVSKALVGSVLQSIPAFRGLDGKFDQAAYERLIAQRGLTNAQVQDEIARETLSQFLLTPHQGAAQVPMQLALPYASLLLERRSGQIGLIPLASVPEGAAPTPAELQAWYKAHLASYTTPQRRVIRYAIVTPDRVRAGAAPTDAEVQQAYGAAQARFAARQTRTVGIVTVLDQGAANALAQKVRGGTSLADAARAAGLEARTLDAVDKAAAATQTSPAAADAIFAAKQGDVVGPVRAAIGFVVARVDKVTDIPATPLAQARPALVRELTEKKTAAALQKIQDAIDDSLGDNANLSEVAADQKLDVRVTPALLSNGTNPDAPGTAAEAQLQPVVTAGFAAEDGDTPTLVPLGQDGSFAIVGLDRIVPATPVPLAKVSAQVTRDLIADRRQRQARTIANAALAKVNAGTPLAAALAQSGIRTPPPEPVQATRAQLAASRERVNPALALLFSMAKGTAKVLAAPQQGGFLVIKLDQVVPGNAAGQPPVIAATRQDLGRVIGREYVQQLVTAIGKAEGVKRHPEAIAKLKKDLAGQGGSDQ